MLDRDIVARHLLAKQHLAAGTAGTDILTVAEDLVGLHGTSPTGPYLSLHARMRHFARADLDRELYENRSLMRLKVMRGTVFVLSHRLAPVAYGATHTSTIARDLRYLGLDRATYDALAPEVTRELAERSLTAAELRDVLGGGGNLAAVVGLLCDEGRLVRDRPKGSWRSVTYRYRLWQAALPDVDLAAHCHGDAVKLLVQRYLMAYGPATLSDVAWWSGLGVTVARQAVQQLDQDVVEVAVEGATGRLLMARDDLAALHNRPPADGPCVALLPELDPLTMGYKERGRYLQPCHQELVFDRGGNATSTILVDGMVVGVWDVTDRPEPCGRVLLFDGDHPERGAIFERAAAAGTCWFGESVPVAEYSAMIPLTKRSGVMRKPLDEAKAVARY